jgi:YD repeat-containing protein
MRAATIARVARGRRCPAGHTTQFEYDLADRLVRETTPIGKATDYVYDAAGRRIEKLDGKSQPTRYEYDAAAATAGTDANAYGNPLLHLGRWCASVTPLATCTATTQAQLACLQLDHAERPRAQGQVSRAGAPPTSWSSARELRA